MLGTILTNKRSRLGKRIPNALSVEALEARRLLAVLVVTTNEPTGAGSLAEAVELANTQPGADVIRFARDVRGTIEVSETLQITDDLRIDGPGARRLTLSGGGEKRIMTILSLDSTDLTQVRISGLTFADGKATDAGPFLPEIFAFGGGIYNVGSDLTLHDMVFRNNNAAGFLAAGGAVANEFGGTLRVSGTTFEDNSSDGILIGVGGAIASDIGPTEDGEGTPIALLNVATSTFENNSATAATNDPGLVPAFAPFSGFAFGGAISALSTDATVRNSRFMGNSVQGGDGVAGVNGGFANGGAIFADDFSPFDVVENPGRDSFIDIHGSTFVDNSSQGGTGGEGDTVGGGAAGGAVSISISFFPETAQIRNSHFRYNTATAGDGPTGGLAIGGALSILTGAEVDVRNSHFSDNAAQGGSGLTGKGGDAIGGAIGVGQLQPSFDFPLLGLPPKADISSSFFMNNLAVGGIGAANNVGGTGAGGAIGVVSGAANISSSQLLRNRAEGGSAGTGGTAKGGAIYNSGAEVTLARSLIFANIARGGEGEDEDGTGFGGGVFNDLDNSGSLIDIDRLTMFLAKFNSADEGRNFFGI